MFRDGKGVRVSYFKAKKLNPNLKRITRFPLNFGEKIEYLEVLLIWMVRPKPDPQPCLIRRIGC